MFNAHWLTYFDEASTRFFESLGFEPSVAFFRDFDVMVVKAVARVAGPGRVRRRRRHRVAPGRLGTKSFDLVYTATVAGRPACVGTITYVSVTPGTHESAAIPSTLRAALRGATTT